MQCGLTEPGVVPTPSHSDVLGVWLQGVCVRHHKPGVPECALGDGLVSMLTQPPSGGALWWAWLTCSHRQEGSKRECFQVVTGSSGLRWAVFPGT